MEDFALSWEVRLNLWAGGAIKGFKHDQICIFKNGSCKAVEIDLGGWGPMTGREVNYNFPGFRWCHGSDHGNGSGVKR